MISRAVATILIVFSVLCLAACQTPPQTRNVVLSTKSAVELRAMQSRAFETTDRIKTLRTVIATLQDLGYKVDKVEPEAGTVSATKLAVLRLTATVYPHGTTQLTVRANALVKLQNGDSQVDDPEFYQKLFFEPLSKAMFLAALNIQDDDDPSKSSESRNNEQNSAGTGNQLPAKKN